MSSSPAKVHALLIGVDDYRAKPLAGCVNDIEAIRHWLIHVAGVPAADVRCLLARRAPQPGDSRPTRAAILSALEDLATAQVGPEDHVLIYYAGHGERDYIHGTEFERDALVALDATGESEAIHDWEINDRLAAIALKTHDVTVVLDCCHSAGMTRGDDGEVARWLPGKSVAGGPRTPRGIGPSGERKLRDVLVIAACQEDETASENLSPSGRVHGVLTNAILAAIAPIPVAALRSTTWSALWATIQERVEKGNPFQHPWAIGELARGVLGGRREERSPGLVVKKEGSHYVVGAGTLLDVTTGARVAVYGPRTAHFPPIATPEERDARVGTLVITNAGRYWSAAIPETSPFELPSDARGRLVQAGEGSRLRVFVDPALSGRLIPSLTLFEVVSVRTGADVRLELSADGTDVLLRDDVIDGSVNSGRAREYVGARAPLAAPELEGWMQRLLEHYAVYARPFRLVKHALDLLGVLRLSVLDCNDQAMLASIDPQAADLPPVRERGGIPTVRLGERYCFRVDNWGTRRLKVALLECGIGGQVLYHGDAILDPGASHIFWSYERVGSPWEAAPPPGLSRVVAIGTTDKVARLQSLACGSFEEGHPDRTARLTKHASSIPSDRWGGVVRYLDTVAAGHGEGKEV